MAGPFIWGPSGALNLQTAIQIPGSTSGNIILQPSATTTPYTITLPAAAPAGNGYSLTATTAGVCSWTLLSGTGTVTSVALSTPNSLQISGSPITTSGTLAITATTVPAVITSSTYAVNTTDYSLKFSGASNSITITMPDPTATSVKGQIYYLTRTDSTITNTITIDPHASETFGAFAYTSIHLATQGESWALMSDGTSWVIIQHYIPTHTLAWTPTFTGVGTVSNNNSQWVRIGDKIRSWGSAQAGTVSGTLEVSTPSGVTINFSGLASNTQVGSFTGFEPTGTSTQIPNASYGPWALWSDGSTNALFKSGHVTSNAFSKDGAALSNSSYFTYEYEVTVSGWEG